MRAAIRGGIIGDSTLVDLGVIPEGVLSGDVDTPQARPFLNLKWGTVTPALGGVVFQTTLDIWVHDKPNDYDRINEIIDRLRVLLPSLIAMTSGTDYVSQMAWTGDGPDLKDDGHRSIAKVSSYTINSSKGEA